MGVTEERPSRRKPQVLVGSLPALRAAQLLAARSWPNCAIRSRKHEAGRCGGPAGGM